MTEKLRQILKEKHHTIDNINYLAIAGYPPPDGNERIYFFYIHKNYLNRHKEIITKEQIKNIAGEVFDDVGWNFYEDKGLKQNVIKFHNTATSFGKEYAYQSWYDSHNIGFGSLEIRLNITIETGNRGLSKLNEIQRMKYSLFIDKIVEQTILNTEKYKK